MGRAQREKGKRGEKLVRDILRDLGFTARRAVQYCGDASDADVIADALPECFIEAKNVAKVPCNAWLTKAKAQAKGKLPLIFAHQTHQRQTVLVMDAADLVRVSRLVVAAIDGGDAGATA